mgnify:CR=1 FL=1
MIKKLSEFILELENFQKEYGDLVVACLVLNITFKEPVKSSVKIIKG